MQDKPLEQAEQDLLDLIRQLHADHGPILRTTLSVVGRGRGLDVARSLGRLKTLGLVEEFEKRPFFLLRLFGARPTSWLRPVSPPEVKDPAKDPVAGPVEIPAETPVQPPVVAVAEVAPPQPEIVAPEIAAPEVSAVKAPAEPEVAAPDVRVPEFAAPEPLSASPVVLTPEAAPVAGVAPPPVVPAPVVPTPVAPTPVAPPARPVRLAPNAYTDEIGGQPLAVAPAVEIDPELLEGLHEMLELLGMEITVAGDALIGNRMSRGALAGEALLQVVVFAFAHAARYDLLSGSPVPAEDLREYGQALVRELEKLREAGEIRPEAFDRDMALVLALADKTGTDDTGTSRPALIEELLSDPVGGIAPPALLPEGLRGLEEYEDD